MKRLIAFVAAMLVSAGAFAAIGTNSGALNWFQAGQVIQGDQGAILIGFANNNTTPATCAASANYKYFSSDPTTAQGRAAISMAQLAFTTGRSVTAEGTGTCSVYPNVEDLGYISFSY